MDLLIILTLEKEISETELKKGNDVVHGHGCSIVKFRVLFQFDLVMVMVASTDTDVNRASTS